MSNLESGPETRCGGQVALADPAVSDWLDGRDVPLGPRAMVRRLLPHQFRRMVGAWCFLDQFGPEDLNGSRGMSIGPHPHSGLQTVTWLLAGAVLHRDSLGSEQRIEPYQLNLMTSGAGISHSEESPAQRPPTMHGLQLWVALPEASRAVAPRFDHHAQLPRLAFGAGTRGTGPAQGTLLMGEIAGAVSPALTYSPLIGLDLELAAGASLTLPLQPDFEYAVLATKGEARVQGRALRPDGLLYLGRGRGSISLTAEPASRLFLLGGEPFEEELVMWWNFVARSHEEIVQARQDWADESPRFGEVRGFPGPRLGAPALPTTTLKPRDRHGRTMG